MKTGDRRRRSVLSGEASVRRRARLTKILYLGGPGGGRTGLWVDVRRVVREAELTEAVRAARRGSAFLHLRTQPRANRQLPRPESDVAERFAAWLRANP